MRNKWWGWLVLLLVLWTPFFVAADGPAFTPRVPVLSDHFDGQVYFNLGVPPEPQTSDTRNRGASQWIWRVLFGDDFPEWPEYHAVPPGPPPVTRAAKGEMRVTPVGHATALIQMDGLNLLIDPIWSERCSPVSWAGPKRRQPPGIRFTDLPPIDAVLVSHNHYDHLDLPTLRGLAEVGVPLAVTPLGNGALIWGAGISRVEEVDWWETVSLSPEVTVTCVPAQHFSSRSLWDRNEALWGGFVISGPSGQVYHAGDTGYGPHFNEIARRFPDIRVALLSISPYRPVGFSTASPPPNPRSVHKAPAEAVQAHLDLGVPLSVAIHYRVFRLGIDGFDEAVRDLAAALKAQGMAETEFLAPPLGWAIIPPAR